MTDSTWIYVYSTRWELVQSESTCGKAVGEVNKNNIESACLVNERVQSVGGD
jgi:hypothetical protein